MVGKHPETATNRCFTECIILKILQYSQESTYAAVSF